MGLGFKELKLCNSDTSSADGSLGKITFTNTDNGSSFAKIEAKSDATLGLTDLPGRLVFSTTPDNSDTLSDRMVIKHNGYIGIGNTDPQGLLHMSSGTSGDCALIIEADTDNNEEGDNPRIEFRQDAGMIESVIFNDHNNLTFLNTVSANGGISFKVGTSDLTTWSDLTVSGISDAMKILSNGNIYSNGNIGIGTSSPLTKLHIAGTSSTPNFVMADGDNPRYSIGIGSNHVSGTGQRMDFYVGDSGNNSSNLDSDDRLMSLTKTGVLCLNEDTPDSSAGGIQAKSNGNGGKYALILKTANEEGAGNQDGGFFGMMWLGYDGNNFNLGVFMKDNGSPYSYHQIGIFENDNFDNGAFFTGQHRNILNTSINENHVGLIVKSSGDYINISGDLRPSINESLPICSLVNTDNDPSVFGVISNKEDSDNDRTTGTGSFKSVSKKTYTNEQRLYINSVGEGGIWVCSKNGDLVNGDYITSCTIPGYGAKQTTESGTLKNYTVAKITCDCNFPVTQIVKQKIKIIETSETLTRDVKTTTTINETKTVITYDTVNSRYVQSEVTESKEVVSQVYDTVDLYDTNGNVIGTYQAPRTETYTNTTQQIDYDANGNVQYEDDLDANNQQQMIYKFDTRFIQEDGTLLNDEADYNTRLANGENVYKACFVGCTYHCG